MCTATQYIDEVVTIESETPLETVNKNNIHSIPNDESHIFNDIYLFFLIHLLRYD